MSAVKVGLMEWSSRLKVQTYQRHFSPYRGLNELLVVGWILDKTEDSAAVKGRFELGVFCDLSISSRATNSQGTVDRGLCCIRYTSDNLI
jgi:hypothetical protein